MDDFFSQDAPRTMLITGATGFIGSRLATLALSHGYSVKTLTRSGWTGAPAVPAGQRYFGELPEQIPTQALEEVDVVVHCAASFETAESNAKAVNVDGTIRLANLAHLAGVRTLIFLSSQSARLDALSAYGRTKYAAEQALLELLDLNVIILRPGLVTGTGSRGLFQRMSRMVESLPLVPLLGGGNSIVQPIHVDDLCEGIFRCVRKAAEMDKRILSLGDPRGVSLAEFLQTIAVARIGRRRLMLPIPIWPVDICVRLSERLGIRLPINSNNLNGLKVVEKMETMADLAALDLKLRSLDETIRDGNLALRQTKSPKERSVRVLLIGAGRIGLVHALTLSRLDGVELCGVVDPKFRARALLEGMGLTARMFKSLDEALSQASPEAVVIATPPPMHPSLARVCIERGLPVMIEKPLAIQPEHLAHYELLAQEFPDVPVQAGYVMLNNPQVSELLRQLHSGRFGNVKGFVGVTLLSFIQKNHPERWEVNKSKSGGGALINSGGHVLSMIHAAFGEPLSLEAQSLKLHSTEVEDSIVVNFSYPEFQGRHYCTWSINGYPRQENRLIVRTDKGQLIMTCSVGVFINNAGEIDITHQLDFDVGFNLAPNNMGAGFSTELNNLKSAVRSPQSTTSNLSEALKIERLLFKTYENSHETKSFAGFNNNLATFSPCSTTIRLSRDCSTSTRAANSVRVLDLRDLSVEDIAPYFERTVDKSDWSGYLVFPDQFARLPAQSLGNERLRVTVPNFVHQSRLLSTARYREVLVEMGPSGLGMALRAVAPMLIRERGANFWVAAIGLLASALHAVPSKFDGTLLLDVYLTDLSLTLRRLDMLEGMLAMCRRLRPRARVGFHTNMAAEALHALQVVREPIEEVSVLTSPRALRVSEIFAAMRHVDATGKLRITAEVGLAPDIVHRVASDAPECWAHGADALLIGIGADAFLAQRNRERCQQEWDKVFPDLSLPDVI